MDIIEVKEKFMFIVNEIISSKEKQDASINKGHYLKGKADIIAKVAKLLSQPPSALVLEQILAVIEAETYDILTETKTLEAAQAERKRDTVRILSLIENLDKIEPIQ